MKQIPIANQNHVLPMHAQLSHNVFKIQILVLSILMDVVQVVAQMEYASQLANLKDMVLTRKDASALWIMNALQENAKTTNAHLNSRGGHTLFCLEEL